MLDKNNQQLVKSYLTWKTEADLWQRGCEFNLKHWFVIAGISLESRNTTGRDLPGGKLNASVCWGVSWTEEANAPVILSLHIYHILSVKWHNAEEDRFVHLIFIGVTDYHTDKLKGIRLTKDQAVPRESALHRGLVQQRPLVWVLGGPTWNISLEWDSCLGCLPWSRGRVIPLAC